MRQHFYTQPWTTAGLSRFDTLLSLTLGMVLLAALGYLFLAQPRLVESRDTARAYMQNAHITLDVISREVRMSGYNPTGASFDGLLVTPTSLHIKADLNGDGDTDDTDEDIRYTYDASRQEILRTDRQGQEVLAEHVRHFTVLGLDETGQPSTASSTLRRIRLQVQTGPKTPSTAPLGYDNPQTYTLTTFVKVRNISTLTEHERG